MSDRRLDRVADDFVLARQSLAERDAAIARVRAHFDDDTPLNAVDVRTLLADHARAISLVSQLQDRLRGEKHHHENDVTRLQELLGRSGAALESTQAALVEMEKKRDAWKEAAGVDYRDLDTTPDEARATNEARQARIDAALALTEPDPLRHWDTQWPIRAVLEGMTAAEYAGEAGTDVVPPLDAAQRAEVDELARRMLADDLANLTERPEVDRG